ncbi:enoyl-hydratase isomerase family [Fusarium heterosporum]|uniref:Enoyl-hydratase isomerase family n=1 Tax=Fusarium heterosporum TaxID=42747 RepID=A0A8H5U191_FUSHE|nr:enoyl-hydratase isomerase family [Fusarium heterosporum]
MSAAQLLCDVPELTAIERTGPRGYLRYVFPMRLAQDYNLDEVLSVLHDGYRAACQRIGVLASEAVPDIEAKQANVLKLQRRSDDEIGGMDSRDLRGLNSYPWTFAQLKDKHFPISAFDADLLMPGPLWPQSEKPIPISLVQANFIQGGILIGWNVFHMVGDATTYLTWTKVWAEECRRCQGLPVLNPLVIDKTMISDRQSVVKPSGRNRGLAEDHPEYIVLPFTPTGASPAMLSRTFRGQVFYFSPSSLQALKAEASPANATKPTDQQWISTNDAFSALMWRTAIAVQAPIASLNEDEDPVSVFNIAVDGRKRTDQLVHPATMGCFLEYIAVSAPIRQLLSDLSLADLAVLIRNEMSLRLNNQFTDDVVILIDQLEDVTRLVPTAFLEVLGRSSVQTSWADFNLATVRWGGLLGDRIGAVRCPNTGILPGCHVVLPALPDGGVEVVFGTEGELLPKVLEDPLWMKFAEPR